VLLSAAVALAAGCGQPQVASQDLGPAETASYDHYFFEVQRADDAASRRTGFIKSEIERLATSSWEGAWANIIAAGKESVPWLVANLDRKDETHVLLRPVPGPALPGSGGSWNLGRVVYAVLVDLVASYGNVAGPSLPPMEETAWEHWWNRNKKSFATYTAAGTAPAYVRKQQQEALKELAHRFPDFELERVRRLRDLAGERAETQRKADERARRLEERKRKTEAAKRSREEKRARARAERAKAAEAGAAPLPEPRVEKEPSEPAPGVEGNASAGEAAEPSGNAAPAETE
jgi:hypothetical protein